MKKTVFLFSLFLMAVMNSAAAFAGEAAGSAVSTEKLAYYAVVGVSIIAGISLAVVGGALGQGNAISAAVRGIAKNKEAGGKIMIPLVVGLAFIESLVIYSLVVGLILLFGNPFKI